MTCCARHPAQRNAAKRVAFPNVTEVSTSTDTPQDLGARTQAIRFIVSGGIAAVVDLGLSYLFQIILGFGPGVSRTVGFIFGTLTAYMINRRWTFQAEASSKRFLAVVVLYSITYGVNVGGHKLLFYVLDGVLSEKLAFLFAFLISQGTATVINFLVQRMVIFKR